MRMQRTLSMVLNVSCIIVLACSLAQAKSKYACDEADPASMCTAANTCGSASAPCTVDITKAGSSSNVKPGIPNAKNNQFFCIKNGTTVVWMTSNKKTGFMVSFGTDSPFDPDEPDHRWGQQADHGEGEHTRLLQIRRRSVLSRRDLWHGRRE